MFFLRTKPLCFFQLYLRCSSLPLLILLLVLLLVLGRSISREWSIIKLPLDPWFAPVTTVRIRHTIPPIYHSYLSLPVYSRERHLALFVYLPFVCPAIANVQLSRQYLQPDWSVHPFSAVHIGAIAHRHLTTGSRYHLRQLVPTAAREELDPSGAQRYQSNSSSSSCCTI